MIQIENNKMKMKEVICDECDMNCKFDYDEFYEEKIAICQSCGSDADRQSDLVCNGRDDLYSCPICKGPWMQVCEFSLPIQLEKK